MPIAARLVLWRSTGYLKKFLSADTLPGSQIIEHMLTSG